MKKTLIIGILIIIVGGAAWWISSMHSGPATTPSSTLGIRGGAGQSNTGGLGPSPVLGLVVDPNIGDYLIAQNGMTLYVYASDPIGSSTCFASCAAAWPPYTTSGTEPLIAGAGVTGTVGTITRPDGSIQVTYNGAPLYFFKNDGKPGDTTGNKVGGVWFAAHP